MFNACVQAVQSFVKNRGSEHILCAAYLVQSAAYVANYQYSTVSAQLLSQPFSTQFRARFNLLNVQFSTVCTGPITRTINNF